MRNAGSRFMKRARLAALLAVGATALAAGPVFANPIVNWTYSIDSQFDTTIGAGHTTYSSGCTMSGGNTTTAQKLAWGCASTLNERSSLVLNPFTGTGSLVTNGGPDTTDVILTHNNFVITGSHLLTTNLMNTITLTPSWGGAQALDFAINFTETPNSGTCVVQDGGPKCSDIFVINDTIASPPTYTTADGTYTLHFGLMGYGGTVFGPLTGAECVAAGASAGCNGFTTKENQSNSLALTLFITGPSSGGGGNVPEPSALGMMGLGLLSIAGLAILRRRRSAKDNAD